MTLVVPTVYVTNSLSQVTVVRWWMAHYQAPTAKRHLGFANSTVIRRLDRGKLHVPRGGPTKGKVKTCQKYKDANGKTRYKGTRHLRATELLDVDLYFFKYVDTCMGFKSPHEIKDKFWVSQPYRLLRIYLHHLGPSNHYI